MVLGYISLRILVSDCSMIQIGSRLFLSLEHPIEEKTVAFFQIFQYCEQLTFQKRRKKLTFGLFINKIKLLSHG